VAARQFARRFRLRTYRWPAVPAFRRGVLAVRAESICHV